MDGDTHEEPSTCGVQEVFWRFWIEPIRFYENRVLGEFVKTACHVVVERTHVPPDVRNLHYIFHPMTAAILTPAATIAVIAKACIFYINGEVGALFLDQRPQPGRRGALFLDRRLVGCEHSPRMRGAVASRGLHDARGRVGGVRAAEYPLRALRGVPRQQRARALTIVACDNGGR
eukprot:CAMPEP_0171822716 /NCGR_PEP_ID=MMETSP0992-20121227/4024_1 /TAXON_ID=483369 /ORGANISM="non described non described, Strain CCMP2098" /LENGTH=174 /DNA_ID=CAMNT_0012437343 /DNA_START=2151 /DNA_END=2672 /DNA_ORIENTATION=+